MAHGHAGSKRAWPDRFAGVAVVHATYGRGGPACPKTHTRLVASAHSAGRRDWRPDDQDLPELEVRHSLEPRADVLQIILESLSANGTAGSSGTAQDDSSARAASQPRRVNCQWRPAPMTKRSS